MPYAKHGMKQACHNASAGMPPLRGGVSCPFLCKPLKFNMRSIFIQATNLEALKTISLMG